MTLMRKNKHMRNKKSLIYISLNGVAKLELLQISESQQQKKKKEINKKNRIDPKSSQ